MSFASDHGASPKRREILTKGRIIRRIVVFATSFLDKPVVELVGAGQGAALLERLVTESGGTIEVEYRCGRRPTEPVQPEELAGVSAVIADLEAYPRSLLEQVGARYGRSLGLIARYGVGIDAVDLKAATEAGVIVANTPGANTHPTAEWAVATLLDIAGRRMPAHRRAAAGETKDAVPRLDVTGKTLGVIGTGAIGKCVVKLLRGFDVHVVAYDPVPDTSWAESAAVSYRPLPEVISQADFVTLHAAVGDRILGAAEIAAMKKNAVLVNCARSVLVDNRAAYAAVREGHLWGYGLDETWTEEDLPLGNLNIAVSSHIGSDTDGGKAAMQLLSARAVVDWLEGRIPEFAINADAVKSGNSDNR